MRWWPIVVGLAVLARCGGSVASTAAGPGAARPLDARVRVLAPKEPAPSVSSEALPPPPAVRFLEHPERLSHLFLALADLDSREARDDVRIVQYGDSHTAADFGTSAVRRDLQARFGDGGRGFVSLGQPWKTFGQEGIDGGMSREFSPVHVGYHHGKVVGDGGVYGLLGVAVGTTKAGARAWTAVRSPTGRIEIAAWQQPRGGSFDVFVDGVRQDRVSTRGAPEGSLFVPFETSDGYHDIEVRTLGDGDVRIFGMILDRPQFGIVVDALGINGAQISSPLHWNEEHFVEQLHYRDPALVVLAYGTNESMDPTLADEDFIGRAVALLGRVERAAPASSCLLLGPPDRGQRALGPHGVQAKRDIQWENAPRVVEIANLERRVADAAGCAYFDQIEAMGGPGSMVAWAAEPDPRAASDRVHLTRSGYAELGRAFSQDVIHAYETWRLTRGLAPPKLADAGAANPELEQPIPPDIPWLDGAVP